MKGVISIYWCAALMNLSGNLFGFLEVAMMSKPFLMITLAHYAWHQLQEYRRLANMISGALLLSWLGDILLIFGDQKLLFLMGLIAFAGSHILYSITFLSSSRNEVRIKRSMLLAIPIVLLLAFIMSYGFYLQSYVVDLELPVAVYTIIIGCMCILAMMRYGWTNSKSYSLTVTGALLFACSDSILAYGKFIDGFSFHGFLVMLTYILGQWFITKGMIEHIRN